MALDPKHANTAASIYNQANTLHKHLKAAGADRQTLLLTQQIVTTSTSLYHRLKAAAKTK